MAKDGTIKIPDITTPDTPASGFKRIYAKVAGFFQINSAGAESKLLDAASNLSDVGSGVTSRTNLYKLSVNVTPASNTATTSEEILHSHQIAANKIAIGDALEILAMFNCNNNANAKTGRLYFNTTNSLSGATLLATASMPSITGGPLARMIPIKTNTTTASLYSASTSHTHPYLQVTSTFANITIPDVTAGFWIIFSGQKASSGDTLTLDHSYIKL
jgi:hypothetical protein